MGQCFRRIDTGCIAKVSQLNTTQRRPTRQKMETLARHNCTTPTLLKNCLSFAKTNKQTNKGKPACSASGFKTTLFLKKRPF